MGHLLQYKCSYQCMSFELHLNLLIAGPNCKSPQCLPCTEDRLLEAQLISSQYTRDHSPNTSLVLVAVACASRSLAFWTLPTQVRMNADLSLREVANSSRLDRSSSPGPSLSA